MNRVPDNLRNMLNTKGFTINRMDTKMIAAYRQIDRERVAKKTAMPPARWRSDPAVAVSVSGPEPLAIDRAVL
jgi:hypothetical protein